MSTSVRLSEVALFDPPAPNRDSLVGVQAAFVPMSSMSADAGDLEVTEARRAADCLKGYTYFQDGDLLVAKITPCFENGKIGQARISEAHAFGSTEFHVVRPKADNLNARYLHHLLRTPEVRAAGERRMTGSAGQRRVPRAFLEELQIPLPPLAEQRKIAELLDKVETLRTKNRCAAKHTDALALSLFDEMFSIGEAGQAEIALGDVIASGPQNGLYKHSSAYGSGTPILRIDGFYDGQVEELSQLKRVVLTQSEIETYKLHEGDIVINRVNSRDYLGKSAIIPHLNEETVFESNMMRFSVDKTRILPGFLIRALQRSRVRKQILQCAKDAVNQSSINQTDVKNLKIALPPLERQKDFLRSLARIEEANAAYQRAAELATQLLASLQHRAFQGEL